MPSVLLGEQNQILLRLKNEERLKVNMPVTKQTGAENWHKPD